MEKNCLTVDEMPHITGSVWNLALQSPDLLATCDGVFKSGKADGSKEGAAYGTNIKNNIAEGFHIDFGANKPHNNTPLAFAVYGWYRIA